MLRIFEQGALKFHFVLSLKIITCSGSTVEKKEER